MTRLRQHYRAASTIAIVIVTLAFATSTTAATAAVRYKLPGGGFGHGIGMSQYGAQGYALKDRSYRDIIGHYYTGTTLKQAKTRAIRVLLQSGVASATFSGADRAAGKDLDPKRTYKVTRRGDEVRLVDGDGKTVASADGELAASGAGALTLGGRTINNIRSGRFRGSLVFSAKVLSGLATVNEVGLDDYVKGVVPGEVPTSWHPEALKAQAVAARTYALATDAGGSLFDQYPDTRSQVYRGANAEVSSTNKAVEATAGETVYYGDKIAVTYFFSTSGGRTENVENVFYGSSPKPWLVSVEDPYDDISPRHRWRLTLTTGQLQAKLGDWVKGRLRGVRVVKRGVSRRVVAADVLGSRGKTRVTGAMLRSRLGLYDTWVSFNKVRPRKRKSATSPSTGAEPTAGPASSARP